MGYQFFLLMVLRWRASRAEAPLLPHTSPQHIQRTVLFYAIDLQFIKRLQWHSLMHTLCTYNTLTLYHRLVMCDKNYSNIHVALCTHCTLVILGY